MTATPLCDALLSRLGGRPVAADASRSATGGSAALEERLTQAVAQAEAAWPGVRVERTEFARYLGERLGVEGTVDTGLAELDVRDLYLACACANGDPAALRAFEVSLIDQVPAFLSRLRAEAAMVDEVKQALRAKLLVKGASGAARITEYSGRGKLGSWLRVAAIRAALDIKRAEGPAAGDNESLAAAPLATAPSPEIDYLRARYEAPFAQAVRDALAELPLRDRNLLRMHLIDGANGEEIAAVYRVNRSTVSRWLNTARQALLERTCALLRERLKLTPSELDSLLGLVASRLDVSVRMLLQGDGG